LNLISNEPRILKEPAPFIGVNELADSSVNLAIWVWVNKADYLSVLFYLREAIKERFDKENITIPFPQRELHIPGPLKVEN
jgi:small conductance mechanosensitive channel